MSTLYFCLYKREKSYYNDFIINFVRGKNLREILKSNSSPPDSKEIRKAIEECDAYREKLIKHCRLRFDYDRETAEDCVQNAFAALYDNLARGVKIKNPLAWLYQVTLNYSNRELRERIRRREYGFAKSEEKEAVMEKALAYSPDFLENMVSDEAIEDRAMRILSTLNKDEKALYIARYRLGKSFETIALETELSPAAVRKRHERLRKKLMKMIKAFEKN